MNKAKVFWSGRSQAIRLPKEFRVATDEVSIKRRGNALILEPIASDWKWLVEFPGKLDADVVVAVNENSAEQHRPELDEFFR